MTADVVSESVDGFEGGRGGVPQTKDKQEKTCDKSLKKTIKRNKHNEKGRITQPARKVDRMKEG